MRTTTAIAGLVLSALLGCETAATREPAPPQDPAAATEAAEAPETPATAEPPQPTREPVDEQKLTAFLERLAGEWTYTSESMTAPDQPWAKGKGEQSAALLGRWCVMNLADLTSPAFPLKALFTIGHDGHTGRIVASWQDSMQSMRWDYVGTLSKNGDTLHLDADGPNPAEPGSTLVYRHTIVLTEDGKRSEVSSVNQGGVWVEFARYAYTRKP